MSASDYVRQLDRELRRRFARDDDFLDEVRAHLDDAIGRGQRDGLPLDEAQALAVAEFGAPALVAAAHTATRYRFVDRYLGVAAVGLGLAIAYLDALPTWDDTGVTAGLLLLGAALLGLVAPRRPWRWALLIGSWIPAHALLRAPVPATLAMLLVILFPLAGAYAGTLLRRAMA